MKLSSKVYIISTEDGYTVLASKWAKILFH